MTINKQMPKYKSHKEVWALKIKNIALNADDDGITITPEDNSYAPFEAEVAYWTKHEPQIGGYFVQYEDGYKSFSPADMFEAGYTRI